MLYRFSLRCPSCSKISETTQKNRIPEPAVNCGDCLMDRVEVVEMKITFVAEEK